MTVKKARHISSLMDIQAWQKFQDSLAMMTGLGVLTLDASGNQLTEPSNVNTFCMRHLRKHSRNLGLCDKSHEKAARAVASSGKTVVYRCHAGFSYFAIPVLINDVHVTTLVAGQIMRRDFERETLRKFIEDQKISIPDFEGELQRVQTMDEEKFTKTRELIESLVGMITQLNFEKFGLSRKVAELSALHEIANLVGSVGDLDKMLNHLCEKISQLVGIDKCLLVVRDKSMERFMVAATDEVPLDFKNTYIRLTRDVLFERRFLVKDPLLIESADSIRDSAEFAAMYAAASIKRRVTVPLVVRGYTLGLLELYPDKDGELDAETADLFIQVAYQTGVAIDNASIFSHAERLAAIDGLTGLLNFRTFHQQMHMELKRARRYSQQLSIIMFDIDNFKSINDAFGHLIGNIVLSELARILRAGVREVDVVARFGGEEFIIVLPETAGDGAMILAERLRERISEHEFPGPGSKTLRLTVSGGVAEFKTTMSNEDDLIDAADKALLKAKAKGKDMVIRAGAEKAAEKTEKKAVAAPKKKAAKKKAKPAAKKATKKR